MMRHLVLAVAAVAIMACAPGEVQVTTHRQPTYTMQCTLMLCVQTSKTCGPVVDGKQECSEVILPTANDCNTCTLTEPAPEVTCVPGATEP